MHASVKDSTQPSKRATKPAATQPTSTDKQQDANHPSRVAWRQALGERMVENSKRMQHDPEYRAKIQSMTR